MNNLLYGLENKNILVFGLGRSGLSVIRKISPFCKKTKAVDINKNCMTAEELNEFKNASKVEFYLGKEKIQPDKILNEIDIFILSPGISSENELVLSAKKKDIPVISELELSWQLMSRRQRQKTVAVTGTNGKTTLTTFLGFTFNKAGIKAITCGNIGNPLIETFYFKKACEADSSEEARTIIEDDDYIRVIEVSSFQLESITSFAPFCAVILNITEDHIDRHKTMSDYAKIKFRIAGRQNKDNYLVLNYDDNLIKEMMLEKSFKKICSKIILFSLFKDSGTELNADKEVLYYNFYQNQGSINSEKRKLQGSHNLSNLLAGLAVLKIFNVEDHFIENSIKEFEPLSHRLEFIGRIEGINCFNDSKATNPDATIKALENFSGKNVTIILGGLDKNMDFTRLIPVLKKKVRNIILIGECRKKLFGLLSPERKSFQSVLMADNFEDAVKKGLEITEAGAYFILSPSCASMDMFKDYQERGRRFKELLRCFDGRMK